MSITPLRNLKKSFIVENWKLVFLNAKCAVCVPRKLTKVLCSLNQSKVTKSVNRSLSLQRVTIRVLLTAVEAI